MRRVDHYHGFRLLVVGGLKCRPTRRIAAGNLVKRGGKNGARISVQAIESAVALCVGCDLGS